MGGSSNGGPGSRASSPTNSTATGAVTTGGSPGGATSGNGGSGSGGTTSSGGGGGATSSDSGGGATSSSGGSEATSTGSSSGATAGGGGGTGGQLNARDMVAGMGFGTNIGNTLENTSEWETGWGQPVISQAYIDGMAHNGIKTVRVPVAWDTYANQGVIDPSKLNRVKEVVSWIEAAGMYSIVNIHWDGGWIFNESNNNAYRLTNDVRTKFESYWQQIASAFADVGHKLILEGMNEEGRFYVGGDPANAPDYAPLNELNQLFVTTVRGEGGYNASRALLIAGFQTDIDLTCVNEFAIPSDPAGPGKLFLSLHYYSPYTFTLMDTVETWGSPATTWGSSQEVAQLEADFAKAASFSTSRNIPIILGEFAVTRGTNFVREPASRSAWMGSVISTSKAHGIVPVLWDTGSEISRTDGSFSPELQAALN